MAGRERIGRRRLDDRLGQRLDTNGRSRSTQTFSAPEQLSASRIAAPTRVHSHGRLHAKPEIPSAIASQTKPNEPAYERASKNGSKDADPVLDDELAE